MESLPALELVAIPPPELTVEDELPSAALPCAVPPVEVLSDEALLAPEGPGGPPESPPLVVLELPPPVVPLAPAEVGPAVVLYVGAVLVVVSAIDSVPTVVDRLPVPFSVDKVGPSGDSLQAFATTRIDIGKTTECKRVVKRMTERFIDSSAQKRWSAESLSSPGFGEL